MAPTKGGQHAREMLLSVLRCIIRDLVNRKVCPRQRAARPAVHNGALLSLARKQPRGMQPAGTQEMLLSLLCSIMCGLVKRKVGHFSRWLCDSKTLSSHTPS